MIAVVPTPRTPPDMDAWALVTAAQAGDRDAYGQLYDRYVDVVYRFVLYRVGDRPLAEDITGETFTKALRRIDSVTYTGRDIGAWFVTIARNLIYDHMKSSRHQLEVPLGPQELGTNIDNHTPEKACLEREITDLIRRCVGRLVVDDQREVLELRFLAGLSVAETALVMGRAASAVKALQHRAIRKLAQMRELTGLRG